MEHSHDDWAVRADRLQAAGDPWGQRIALWMANARATDAREQSRLLEALAELDSTHGERLYGPELLAALAEDEFPENQLHWEYGYIVGATIVIPQHGGFGTLRAADFVQALVRSPATEFLRYMSIRTRGTEVNCLRDAISASSTGHPLRSLEYLGLGPDSREQVTQAALGDPSPLWPITPALQKLWLRGCDLVLGHFELPALQQLDLETAELPAASVRSLALAVLPKLEHLRLHVWGMHDELAIALAQSEMLGTLRRVGLSGGTMTRRGVRALLDNAERFQHLERLDLLSDGIPEQLRGPLRTAIPVVHFGFPAIRR